MAETTGTICLIMAGNCPSGWTQYATINDKYLRAATTPDSVPAGSNTHSHSSAAHTHSVTIPSTGYFEKWDNIDSDIYVPHECDAYDPSNHKHGAAVNTSGDSSAYTVSTVDHSPPISKFIFCRKD
jgi:hypothetical protein